MLALTGVLVVEHSFQLHGHLKLNTCHLTMLARLIVLKKQIVIQQILSPIFYKTINMLVYYFKKI